MEGSVSGSNVGRIIVVVFFVVFKISSGIVEFFVFV